MLVNIVAMPDLIGTKKIFAIWRPTRKEKAISTGVNRLPSLYAGFVKIRYR
jgi:hypothetical protein